MLISYNSTFYLTVLCLFPFNLYLTLKNRILLLLIYTGLSIFVYFPYIQLCIKDNTDISRRYRNKKNRRKTFLTNVKHHSSLVAIHCTVAIHCIVASHCNNCIYVPRNNSKELRRRSDFKIIGHVKRPTVIMFSTKILCLVVIQ